MLDLHRIVGDESKQLRPDFTIVGGDVEHSDDVAGRWLALAFDRAVDTPVANIAEHYRGTLGRRTADCVSIDRSNLIGTPVSRDYWLGRDAVVPHGDFLFADIPPSAVPETVLDQLEKLV